MQPSTQLAMPFASGLNRHELGLMAKKPALELANPFSRVGYAQRCRGRQSMCIKPGFAYVDTYGTIQSLLFGRFLALHAGRAPYHLLRTRAEDGRTRLPHGPKRPRCFHGPAHPYRDRWPPVPIRRSVCAESAIHTCKVSTPLFAGETVGASRLLIRPLDHEIGDIGERRLDL